eukprot:1702946-Pleurochrysis_carterae.AAC.2
MIGWRAPAKGGRMKIMGRLEGKGNTVNMQACVGASWDSARLRKESGQAREAGGRAECDAHRRNAKHGIRCGTRRRLAGQQIRKSKAAWSRAALEDVPERPLRPLKARGDSGRSRAFSSSTPPNALVMTKPGLFS